jgi:hypothetical protein
MRSAGPPRGSNCAPDGGSAAKRQAWGGHAAWRVGALVLAVMIAGCASLPTPVMPADENDLDSYGTADLTPMVESPPMEPVDPPSPAPPTPPPAANGTSPATIAQAPAPPPVIVVVPEPSTPPPAEDQQMLTLLADLQRFGAMSNEELKREFAAAVQAFGRQHNDINRVRLAVLYTLVRATPQDDQRALQLFESVAKTSSPTSPIRHLAAVLQAQVTERQRAVHDEQQKADAAIQKLEALRAMERSLLRDRVRSGGGGGGTGAGGSGR